MLTIDPDLVGEAVTVLRAVAIAAEDTRYDGISAGQTAGMQIMSLSLVRDLEDDLTLLGTILASRAALALGYQIDAAGTVMAMESLLSSVRVEGDLAIHVAIADGKITDEEWEGLVINGFHQNTSIEDFETYLADNEDLRFLAPFIAELALDPDQTWEVLEMREALIDNNPEHEKRITEIFRPSSDAYPFFDLALFVTPDQILTAAISRGIYNHSAADARNFFLTLPTVESRGYGLDIFTVDSSALGITYEVANRMSTSFEDEVELLLHIPETQDSFRNHRFNVLYGRQADLMENYVDPATGMNWPAWAASASYTVGFGLDGSDSILRAHNPYIKRIDFANGNQAIAMSVFPHFLRLNRLFENGPPSEAEIEIFLLEFKDGEAELRAGFHRQIRAATADSLSEAQILQYEANVLIGVHEQTLIEEFLNFGRMSIFEEIGTQVVTATDGAVELVLDSEDPSAGFRNPGEYMAGEGNLRILSAVGTEYLIPLGQIDGIDDHTLDALKGIRLEDLDLTLDIPGLPHLTTIGEETGRDLTMEEWNQDITGTIQLDDYTNLNDRLPAIMTIFARGSGDPRVRDAARVLAESDPDDLGANLPEADMPPRRIGSVSGHPKTTEEP